MQCMTEPEMQAAKARLDAMEGDEPGLFYWSMSGAASTEAVEFAKHAPEDLRKALAALRRVRALVARPFWDGCYVDIDDIATALNGET